MEHNDIEFFVKSLGEKKVPPEASLRLFKDLQFEALGEIMMKKGYITKNEWDQEHARLAYNMIEKISKLDFEQLNNQSKTS